MRRKPKAARARKYGVAIAALQGVLRRKPGQKSFAEEWADHKREELELEDRKFRRSTGPR